jgi:putative membrane protein
MDQLDKIVSRIAIGLVVVGVLLSIVITQRSSAGSNQSPEQASNGGKATNLTSEDRQFIHKAASAALGQLDLGKLALKKSLSNDVKNFGQQLVDDNAKQSDHLRELAAKKGVKFPARPPATLEAARNRLSNFSGTQFDDAYMAEMLKDHQRNVDEFRSESKATHDPEVRGFVTETLPILEEHLKKAEKLALDLKAERIALQKPNAGRVKTR